MDEHIKVKKNKNKDGKYRDHKKNILIALIIFLVCASLLFIYFALNNSSNLYKDQDAQMGILPGMSDEEIQQRLNTVVSEGMMNVSMNPKPVFANGSAEGSLRIENIKQNHYSYLVTIILDETGEQVYESGLIKPGYFIENAKLNKKLKKGEYQATARFMAYQDKTEKPVGSAVLKITIIVEK